MSRRMRQIGFACATALLLAVACAGWSADIADARFLRVTVPATGWLSSLRRVDDTNRVEFIRPGEALGAVRLRVRSPGSPWSEVRQSKNGIELRSSFGALGQPPHKRIAPYLFARRYRDRTLPSRQCLSDLLSFPVTDAHPRPTLRPS
ncbi:MAG: hypothetical protein NTU53_03345 [Planctomycetota bacterium]|nr:hypothetical protein [Planctomycetota bacterium]